MPKKPKAPPLPPLPLESVVKIEGLESYAKRVLRDCGAEWKRNLNQEKATRVMCSVGLQAFAVQLLYYSQLTGYGDTWQKEIVERAINSLVGLMEEATFGGYCRTMTEFALRNIFDDFLKGRLELSPRSKQKSIITIEDSAIEEPAEPDQIDNDPVDQTPPAIPQSEPVLVAPIAVSRINESVSSLRTESPRELWDAYQAAFPEKMAVLDVCWAARQHYREWMRWIHGGLKDSSKPARAFRALLTSGKKPADYRPEERPKGWK